MPQLRKTEVKRFYLPSFEDLPQDEQAYIDLETPMKMSEFDDVDTTLPQVEQTASIIMKKIKAWNLTDENDQPLEINIKNVTDLDPSDFAFLSVQLGLHRMMRLTAQKKTA